ncbi:hypothetical protein AMS68_005524 [Peltaster fructicola]|uniref:Ketoreductase (KR) domain-containing protein n=1 Tax=Peltaster fructicola TaxID=286661 RepID=A0A6H0XZ29_9PEZI|nr:hypothetical protein AMS68_005524 [Peltaster fructicola]
MSFFEFLSDQWKALPLLITEEACMGRTFIVTGGAGGLGFEAARHLARRRAAKVIIAVRRMDAGEEAKRKIEREFGCKNVEVWKLDLCDFDSVKAFAKQVTQQLDRLDAVIANASVALDSYSVGARGHEETVVINVLATYLLAVLLHPKLRQTASKFKTNTYLSIVASETAFFSVSKKELLRILDAPLKSLDDKNIADMSARYPLSKLLQVLVARQLAQLLPVERTGVVINYLNPGLCKTALSKKSSMKTQIILGIMKALVARTAEVGCRNLLYAVVAGEKSHGRYISNCEVEEDRVPMWITEADGLRHQQLIYDAVAEELDQIEPGCVQTALNG